MPNTNRSTFLNSTGGRGESPKTRCSCHAMVSSWMSSNVEQVQNSRPSVEGGLPSSELSDGSGPSVAIRPPERPVVGSKGSLKIGAGIWSDIRSRIPYYASDWTDAWNYRVVPATTLIFFAKYDVSSTERPNSRNLFQCSPRNCLLFGSHRDDWNVWRCGSFTFFCNGCWGLFGLWGAAVVHSRRYGHVWAFKCQWV